jgi:uncharacterized protein DUF4345
VFVLGLIPVVTGAASLLFGSDVISGGETTSANVESELRFYAAWWIGAGAFLISLAPRIEEHAAGLRAVCGLLVLGAVGRLIGIATAGRPSTLYLVLLAIELLLPVALVPWQARVARAAR